MFVPQMLHFYAYILMAASARAYKSIDILPKGIGNIPSACNYNVYRLVSVNRARCFEVLFGMVSLWDCILATRVFWDKVSIF